MKGGGVTSAKGKPSHTTPTQSPTVDGGPAPLSWGSEFGHGGTGPGLPIAVWDSDLKPWLKIQFLPLIVGTHGPLQP